MTTVRSDFIRLLSTCMPGLLAALTRGQNGLVADASLPLNVLFNAVDDLCPESGCYGSPVKVSFVVKMASDGLLFERACVQVAPLMPLRVSCRLDAIRRQRCTPR